MAKQSEIAELVNFFHGNVDEAEQFSNYIPILINGCKKSELLYILEGLVESVEYNLESSSRTHEHIREDIDVVRRNLEKAKKILN